MRTDIARQQLPDCPNASGRRLKFLFYLLCSLLKNS